MWRQFAQQGDPAWRRSRPESQRSAPPVTKESEPQEAAPRDVAPAEPAPKAVAPKVIAPREVAPKAAAPSVVAPKEIAPKAVTPKAVTPKEIAPVQVVSAKLPSARVAPAVVAPAAVAPRAVASAEVRPSIAVPDDRLDAELRRQLAAADALITQYLPSAAPALLDRMRSVLRGVSRERLQRTGAGGPDSRMDIEKLRQRLVRMSLDDDDGQKELADLRRQLQHYHAFGAWPAGAPASAGSPAKTADYRQHVALLTRIVEENIALRSGRESEQEA